MCKDVSCFLRLPVVYPISTVYHVEVCQLVCCQELKYAGTICILGSFFINVPCDLNADIKLLNSRDFDGASYFIFCIHI